MKMKIKELTLKEIFDLCDKYETDESCRKKCPMRKVCKMYLSLAIDRTELEREVEIDEL